MANIKGHSNQERDGQGVKQSDVNEDVKQFIDYLQAYVKDHGDDTSDSIAGTHEQVGDDIKDRTDIGETALAKESIEIHKKKPQELKDLKTTLVATLRGEYDTQVDDDISKEGYIQGMCMLQDGTLLLTDSYNRKLKRLNYTYEVIGNMKMKDHPHSVCVTGATEVAVLNGNTVQLVEVDDTLALSDSFKTELDFTAMAYVNNCFILANTKTDDRVPSQICLYSKTGQHLRKLDIRPVCLGKGCQFNAYVMISDDLSKIYYTNSKPGGLILSKTGLRKFPNPYPSNAKGMSPIGDGSFLVCGFLSRNIVHLSEDGGKIGELLGDSNKAHRVVFYDQVNSRMIVAPLRSYHIEVYDVNLQM